jgi:hypothetical protein
MKVVDGRFSVVDELMIFFVREQLDVYVDDYDYVLLWCDVEQKSW